MAEAEDKLLTLKGARAAAMMHIAMHDALNAIRPRYQTYAFTGDGNGAEPIAAAAQAAYEVAAHEYPAQREALEQELDRWLAMTPGGEARAAAVALGRESAATILSRREADGWNRDAPYPWRPAAPGEYADFHAHSGTPEGFVFGTGWANVLPFALREPGQFRPGPPPRIQSDAYADAYEEVKQLGRKDSRSRTPYQTHLAMWWKDFVESSHNRLARRLVSRPALDLWAAAGLFALLTIPIVDGDIGAFDAKLAYRHWRPYTAIRRAADDGNPRTAPDPDWTNLHDHTYPLPSYPSAHGTVCAAAMAVMADTFGDERSFTMETREVSAAGPASPKVAMDPPTRSFPTFSAAAMECAMSRVYLGIHFRYDSTAGNALGAKIGRYVLERLLRPSTPPAPASPPQKQRHHDRPE